MKKDKFKSIVNQKVRYGALQYLLKKKAERISENAKMKNVGVHRFRKKGISNPN